MKMSKIFDDGKGMGNLNHGQSENIYPFGSFHFIFSVKVYLSVTDGEKEIEFDQNKIEVSVHEAHARPRNMAIKLNRLTEEEIKKYTNFPNADQQRQVRTDNVIETQPKTQSVTVKSTNIDPSSIVNKSMRKKAQNDSTKRKGDYMIEGVLTRSKRRKLMTSSSQESELTETNNRFKSNEALAKRKSDSEIKILQTKRRKLTEKSHLLALNGMPSGIKVIDSKPSKNEVAKFEFSIGDVVWGKISGSSHWPARIVSIERCGRSVKYVLYWFNDYRISKVFRSQVFTFLSNFQEFATKFSNNIGLETAGKEALIYLSQK